MNAVVVFDLVGAMAHYRKYYTNSSSLTYGFPPRTALMGTIAALLGMERDSYYGQLDQGRYAVALKVPGRRLMQTVNYTRTKKEDLTALRKLGGITGTQVPLELLLPAGAYPQLCFRVFFSHRDEDLLREAAKKLQNGKTSFPLYLGLTECPATAQFRGLARFDEGETIPAGEAVFVTSILNAAHLQEIILGGLEKTGRVFREKAPHSFGPDRELQPPVSILYTEDCRPFPVRLHVPAYTFHLGEAGKETIAFLER